jgi:hypothetical protein
MLTETMLIGAFAAVTAAALLLVAFFTLERRTGALIQRRDERSKTVPARHGT